jgi:hypothetical protein
MEDINDDLNNGVKQQLVAKENEELSNLLV